MWSLNAVPKKAGEAVAVWVISGVLGGAGISCQELHSRRQVTPDHTGTGRHTFIVARRGDDTHERLVHHLAGSSATWAPTASLLIANLAHRYVEGTHWEYSEFVLYDLGQAVAHLALQAEAFGLSVRQFRAFDRDGLAAEFAIPGHWEVTTMAAVGRATRANISEPTPGITDAPPRQRRALSDIV